MSWLFCNREIGGQLFKLNLDGVKKVVVSSLWLNRDLVLNQLYNKPLNAMVTQHIPRFGNRLCACVQVLAKPCGCVV